MIANKRALKVPICNFPDRFQQPSKEKFSETLYSSCSILFSNFFSHFKSYFWFQDSEGAYYWHITSGTIQRDPPIDVGDCQVRLVWFGWWDDVMKVGGGGQIYHIPSRTGFSLVRVNQGLTKVGGFYNTNHKNATIGKILFHPQRLRTS